MVGRSVNGNREFLVPVWSMICLAFEFEFNAVVSFKNRILISIANKILTRMERRILVPIHALDRHFSILGS